MLLLEVGPGKGLSSIALRELDGHTVDSAVVASMRSAYEPDDDRMVLLDALGRLYLAGGRAAHGLWVVMINAAAWLCQRMYSITAPTGLRLRHTNTVAAKTSQPSKNISDWFYVPSWRRAPLLRTSSEANAENEQSWIVFADTAELGAALVQRLRAKGHRVIQVLVGAYFEQRDGRDEFVIDPRAPEDYDTLLQAISTTGVLPDRIAHCWSVQPLPDLASKAERFDAAQDLGFYSLLYLTQSLERAGFFNPLQVWVLTEHTQEVQGDDQLQPEKSTVVGIAKVIPQEYSNLRTQVVDVCWTNETQHRDMLLSRLVQELSIEPTGHIVAYRGTYRWVQEFERVSLPKSSSRPALLRPHGVYMITGGLGPIGLDLARYLVDQVQAKLVITSTTDLPDKQAWSQIVLDEGTPDDLRTKLTALLSLEAAGGQVLALKADVAHHHAMQEAMDLAVEHFGALHGVIHAAGRAQEQWHRTISETVPTTVNWQFHPKAHGLSLLTQVIQGYQLDFCLLTSSLASILGGLGFASYAAANIFMDAFTLRQQRDTATPWITLNLGRVDPRPDFYEVLDRLFSGALLGQVIVEPLIYRCGSSAGSRAVPRQSRSALKALATARSYTPMKIGVLHMLHPKLIRSNVLLTS